MIGKPFLFSFSDYGPPRRTKTLALTLEHDGGQWWQAEL